MCRLNFYSRALGLARFLRSLILIVLHLNLQINVKAARFNIKGKAHMLLFASRKITDGEILCWDYNALIENGFDTSTFL